MVRYYSGLQVVATLNKSFFFESSDQNADSTGMLRNTLPIEESHSTRVYLANLQSSKSQRPFIPGLFALN